MKLFTAEGFSFALQVTSLILLIGYSASKNDLPEISNPKLIEIYPSYFNTKDEDKLYKFPHLHTEIPKKSVELIKTANSIC